MSKGQHQGLHVLIEATRLGFLHDAPALRRPPVLLLYIICSTTKVHFKSLRGHLDYHKQLP